jgi:hypothetical protein
MRPWPFGPPIRKIENFTDCVKFSKALAELIERAIDQFDPTLYPVALKIVAFGERERVSEDWGLNNAG